MVQVEVMLKCSAREFHKGGLQAEKVHSADLRAV